MIIVGADKSSNGTKYIETGFDLNSITVQIQLEQWGFSTDGFRRILIGLENENENVS